MAGEQLVNDVRDSAGTPIGRVRIGSLPSTAHPLVSTLYKRLKERYPLIQLAVREGQGAELETWLEDGSVDLAILYRPSVLLPILGLAALAVLPVVYRRWRTRAGREAA